MKKLIFYSILLLFGQNVFAQTVSNNAWIKYDQAYYKFFTYETQNYSGGGLWRISHADLQRLGFDFNTNARNIQVFWRGKEMAIRVVGEDDSRLDANDYIEFWGKPNDVGFEQEMYDSPSSVSQRYFSLNYPLSSYFLTVGKERGKRFAQIPYTNDQSVPVSTTVINRNIFAETTTATSDGAVYPEGIRANEYFRGSLLSNFAQGKGFYISRNPVGTYSFPFTLTGLADSVPSMNLGLRFMGWLNGTPHIIDLYGESSDTPRKLIKSYTFKNYEILEIDEILNDFRFKRGQNFTFTFQVRQGQVNLCNYSLKYPQTANANFTNRFNLQPNSANRTRLQIANTASNVEFFDVTDEYNIKLIQTNRVGSGLEVLIPDTRQERRFYLNTTSPNVLPSNTLKSSLIPLATDADFIIISHPDLMKPAGGYADPVKAYADYKASKEGGGFKTTVVDIQQIYDQFGYGEYGVLAIRKYMEHIWRSGGRPKHLFLMGRSLSPRFFYYWNLPNSLSWALRDFVPTWGFPCSDSEITESLNGSPRHVSGISTGRLSAMTPLEIANYLDKVKEYDKTLIENPAWRKNILHLSGGFTVGEARSFRAVVDGLKNIAEKEFLGANVSTVAKSNTDYVETINVQRELNNGLLLLTLFGHSSSQFSDIDIGKASDPVFAYNNKGKYPMIVANGCGSGDVFWNSARASAEDWISSKDKGCVLYWAHNHNGFDKTMATYMEVFYRTAFADRNFIAQPIGEIIRETNRRFLQNNNDPTSIANAQQFTLQGDPSLLLFGKNLPDYQITNNSIFVKSLNPRNPNRPTAQDDSFQIGIAISNLGIYQTDSLSVSIRRSLTDGTEETYRQKFKPITNQDTVYFTIINTNRMKQLGGGANRFEVKVDSEERIIELKEDNNRAVLEYFFPKSQVITVAPRDYSIENQETAYLIAQNTNPNSSERLYRFEIDTSFNFNSRLKKDTTIYAYTSPQWTTKLPLAVDSTVYYWRVRPAQFQTDDDTTWANASFVYIKQSPGGWSQSHFHQFRQSTNAGIGQDERSRKWNFSAPQTKIKAKIVGGGRADWADFVLEVNGTEMIKGGQCNPQLLPANFNAVFFLVIDGETGRPYNAVVEQNPGTNCGTSALVSFVRQDFAGLWFDSNLFPRLKDGDYVIIMNSRNANWDLFFSQAPNSLAALGLSMTNRKIGSSGAYLAVGRKGAAANSAFEVGIPITELRDIEYTINHSLRSGSVTSTPIGPALRWNNVFRRIDTRDSQSETWRLDIVGINPNGVENTLFTDVKTDAFDISSIDVGAYPYLRLRATLRDADRLSPMQLKRWQVVFQEVPEGVLLYDSLTYREKNTLKLVEGDSVKIGFYFRNVSNTDFPRPIVVHYNIINESGGGRNYYDTLPPVKRGENRYFLAKIPSTDWIGTNRLQVFVNPRLQPEQIYENNTVEARFTVSRDNIRPILDVAFDGKHLLDGEIVQPTPSIAIQLKDNNKVLKIIDPSTLEVSLRKCPTCAFEKINIWDKTIVNWQVTPEKQLILQYKPQKLDNGTYTLRVQAADRRGNLAGLEPYQINFQVINESMVSNFYPYPNPFSSKAKFVFTLTGKVPDKLRIRIMTITGKTVKTINKEELGNLRVGNNVTDYAWDGTDEFGDQLANGVYIYKVDIQDDTEEVKHFDTAGDQFFKKGYGKIYLMR